MNILARDIRFAPYIQDVRNYVSPFNDSCYPHKELRKILKSIGFAIAVFEKRHIPLKIPAIFFDDIHLLIFGQNAT